MIGFSRKPIKRTTYGCGKCGRDLHTHLVADVLAHAHATGSPVLFACPNCGATLTTAITTSADTTHTQVSSAMADKTE